MAGVKKTTTKKETTKKTTTKAKVEESKINETPQEEVKPQRLSRRKKSESNFIDTDRLDKKRKVPVVNVRSGSTGYICKEQHGTLIWSEYGDEHIMTIGELLLMYSQEKEFLTEPWLIVDDMEFAEVMQLQEIYETIFEIEDLEEFYGQQLLVVKKKLKALPSGTRKELLSRTVNAINNGELNSLAVVRLLKTEYNIDVEI